MDGSEASEAGQRSTCGKAPLASDDGPAGPCVSALAGYLTSMPNPLQFTLAIDAARSGYTWSDILRAYVKFLPRSREGGNGYDVDVTLTPRPHPLFQHQYPAVPFDTRTLDTAIMESDLGMMPAGQPMRVVLNQDGKLVPDAVFERRAVDL